MNPPPPSTAANQTAPSPPPSSQPPAHQLPPSLPTTTVRPATDHHWYNKQFPNQQGIMYPVGTSLRGLAPKNNASRPGSASNGEDRCAAAYSLQQPGRPDALSNQQMQFLNLNASHTLLAGGGSTALQRYPVTSYPKVGFSGATDRNGIREARSKDEALAVVLNRKVRVSEGSSLYFLCRSWLKNGFHDQYQPKHATRYSYLPRPLPTPAQTPAQKSSEPKEVEEDDKEDEKSVELLSPEDLLQRHIKRAKRVRSRLREERLHRITRYKTRLATLLPSPVEAIRDETPAGN